MVHTIISFDMNECCEEDSDIHDIVKIRKEGILTIISKCKENEIKELEKRIDYLKKGNKIK